MFMARYADDTEVGRKQAIAQQVRQGGEQVALRQVAGGAEEKQGLVLGHGKQSGLEGRQGEWENSSTSEATSGPVVAIVLPVVPGV